MKKSRVSKYGYVKVHGRRARVWDVRDIQDGICPHCGAMGENYHPVSMTLHRSFIDEMSKIVLVNVCHQCLKLSVAQFERSQSPELYKYCLRLVNESVVSNE